LYFESLAEDPFQIIKGSYPFGARSFDKLRMTGDGNITCLRMTRQNQIPLTPFAEGGIIETTPTWIAALLLVVRDDGQGKG
jgi:hypothetical protein